jgi:hypothetical protein
MAENFATWINMLGLDTGDCELTILPSILHEQHSVQCQFSSDVHRFQRGHFGIESVHALRFFVVLVVVLVLIY